MKNKIKAIGHTIAMLLVILAIPGWGAFWIWKDQLLIALSPLFLCISLGVIFGLYQAYLDKLEELNNE